MKKGFTLVELLVYVGIFAIASGLMIGIMTTTLKVNQRESASAEATSQLNFVLQTIQRLVRESSAIIVNSNSANTDTDDTVGSQQTRLVLRMKDSVGDNSTDRDPIIIYAENNIIKLSEGRGGYQRISDLTNSRVLADNLKFTKYTQYPGQDTVAIDVQLTYNSQNPDSRVSRTLRTAIARVSAATFDSNLLPGTDNQYEIGYLAGNQRWKNISVSNLISTSNLLNLGQLAVDPTTDAQNGSIYYNTASSTFRGYKNNAWANLGGGDLWTASSTAIYYNGGNVGIGTT
ncbi:MAG: type II secretion system protein, partial [Patescibacteria group bacterium]